MGLILTKDMIIIRTKLKIIKIPTIVPNFPIYSTKLEVCQFYVKIKLNNQIFRKTWKWKIRIIIKIYYRKHKR